MAFDQNTLPLDLRPLNMGRTVVEDLRGILPLTTSGRSNEGIYSANPSREGSPGSSIPVYYPATVPDGGFIGLGYGNATAVPAGVAGWVQRIPAGVVGPSGVSSPGYGYNSPSAGNRVCCSGSDQASDEGGDDTVSGKKVKFLCSFGGKILPRPSDGALRYVGGQTRIISVRRDVSFEELVHKMADTYGQGVVIKYQLPEEDLDALVSVSRHDDLEHMMDEYEKLLERSMDGSGKLRIFLFLASELESPDAVQMGDFEDNGQRYVEAVNGIVEGTGSGIMRRESTISATSTQNSDLSGTENNDSTGHGQENIIGPPSTGELSPQSSSINSQETATRLVCVDPNPAVYVEASGAPLGIQMVRSHPPGTVPMQPVAIVQPQGSQQMGFPPPTSYLQTYVDPHQEALNRSDYVHYPSQMGFPSRLWGTVGPMLTQQQYRDNVVNVSASQFIPAVPVPVTPSSHTNVKPSVVQPIAQPQQVRLECYMEENTYGQRVVHLPGEQSYNPHHAQVFPGGVSGHGWHQAAHPEQVAVSEGWASHQPVVFPDKLPRFEECYMCQKSLPHAHSDTIAQTQKDSPTSATSDVSFHSLRLEDNSGGRPSNWAVVTAPVGEEILEKQATGSRLRAFDQMDHEAIKTQYGGIVVSQNFDGQYVNDRTVLQRDDSHDYPQASILQGVVGFSGGLQSPYSVSTGIIPQSYQENVAHTPVVPTLYQVKQDPFVNKSINVDDASPGDTSPQSLEHLHEFPQAYYGNLPASTPKEVFSNNEQATLPVDTLKKEIIMENRVQHIAGRELYKDNALSKPKMVIDANRYKQNEMLSSPSNEVPFIHNFQPVNSYEVTQHPHLVTSGYPHSTLPINYSVSDDASHANLTAFSAVDSAHVTGRIPLVGEGKEKPSQVQPNSACDVEAAVHIEGNTPSTYSPVQDNLNPLFCSQDYWNLRHDTQFPPPRPNKFLTRKDAHGVRDPFGDNWFCNSGESPVANISGLTTEMRQDAGVYKPYGILDTDYTVRSRKGSTEENIKQDLQAVAEGVAASVLLPSVPCNVSCIHSGSGSASETAQNSQVQNDDVEVPPTDISEDLESKLSERANLGFPVSDGIGRLQIIKNNDLEELRELGSGTFGTVYHGKWRGSDVAIKRISERCFAGKPSEQERMRDDFWNEAINLADLHHPNVVAFYGVVLDGPGGSVATVTEYMVNGSLRIALQKNEKNLDKRKRLLIAMDVAFGMEYLHGKNIVHFDLKSDNLLVNLRDPHRPICKVGDLGLSKVKCQTLISGGVRGTLPWMAPELLNGGSSLVSEKVDVFSFGIVLWELLTGEEPYADLHYGAIIGGIVSNTLRPAVPEICDPEWRSLMERCWSTEPSERPNFTEIANQLRVIAAKNPPKA